MGMNVGNLWRAEVLFCFTAGNFLIYLCQAVGVIEVLRRNNSIIRKHKETENTR